MFSDREIQKVREGEMKTLCDLDANGLSPAVGEGAEEFSKRLENLRKRLQEFDRQLSSQNEVSFDGLLAKRQDRIPRNLFDEPRKQTRQLYDFDCDWVPGFFCNPRFSWLFGGCTYSYPPDFFTVFIIGERLRRRKKYLCYDRDEIFAHELCHVARAGLNSMEFEELFAYQTARSPFRRFLGGIMHSQQDTLIFLLACLFLVVAQVILPRFAAVLPSWLGWLGFGVVMLFFLLRHMRSYGIYQRALRNLEMCCSGHTENARGLLFHATDKEIHQLASTDSPRTLLEQYSASELRWKIACRRFLDDDSGK